MNERNKKRFCYVRSNLNIFHISHKFVDKASNKNSEAVSHISKLLKWDRLCPIIWNIIYMCIISFDLYIYITLSMLVFRISRFSLDIINYIQYFTCNMKLWKVTILTVFFWKIFVFWLLLLFFDDQRDAWLQRMR